jgi:flagellar motor switch protein FliM
MLGGSHQSGSTTRRAPTDIELRLASRIFDLLCDQLRAAWRGIADLPLKLMRVECNPRAVKPAGADAGDDLVVIVRFDVVLGQRRGMMRLCVPGKMIEAVCDRLACDQQASDSRSASPENVERIGRQIGPAETEVEVWLAETQISTNDLISLRVGDIITTPQDVSSPAVVAVSGVPKFHARPGAVKGRKAIVITEPLKPDDCG